LAAAKWLGYWLLASAWLQLSGWAIGLAAAKWLGYWLLAFGFGYWLSDLALAFGFSYWLGYG
jgi:hypothetical protein